MDRQRNYDSNQNWVRDRKLFKRLFEVQDNRGGIFEKIYDPGVRKKVRRRNSIWLVRPVIFVFLLLYFHVLNAIPFLSLNVVTVVELIYGLYILLLVFFSGHELRVETQFLKIILDLSFVTLFEFISLSLFGRYSGLYILFITPVIYCSFWFHWIFTVVFVNITAAIYCLLNYHLLALGTVLSSNREVVRVLGPVVVLLYIVAAGGYYYKRIIQSKREAESTRNLLEYTTDFTHRLLESDFDSIIIVDENGCILSANDRACELLGYKSEELAEREVEKLYARGEAHRVMTELIKRNDGSLVNFKTVILAKSGEEIPILLAITFLGDKSSLQHDLLRHKRFLSIGYFKDMRAEIVIAETVEKSSITGEKEFLDGVAQQTASTLKAEACGLLTYDESSGKLKVVSSYGMPPALKGREWMEEFGLREGLAGRCFTGKVTVCINDIRVNEMDPHSLDIKYNYARNFAKHSKYGDFTHVLYTPLVLHEEVFGVIRVINKYTGKKELDPEGFTLYDQNLLERIASHVSNLVGNVRDKERFEAILKVGGDLHEMIAGPPEEMLAAIPKYVVEGMRFKACYLRLIDDGIVLRIKAAYGFRDKYIGKKEFDLKTGDGSITANAVEKGEIITIDNISEAERYRFYNVAKVENLKAFLCMPLNYRGRVIGTINCYKGLPHRFTDQEILILKAFAAYATTAIQNKKRVDEFKAINEIGDQLAKPIEQEELLPLILEKARAISGADRLCMKIYDESEKKIKTKHSLGCPWHKKHKNVFMKDWNATGNQTAREAYRTGQSKIQKNYEEMRAYNESLKDPHLLESIHSCAIVPITIDEQVYGLIFLESDKQNFFTEDDLLVLEAFSSQAAIAIKNANFVKKLQRVTETFPRISELNMDIDKVLENIADIAAEVLETDVLVLYQYDEEKNEVEWPPIVRGYLHHPIFMDLPVDEKDVPYQFFERRSNHFSNESRKDLYMTPIEKPRTPIPARFVVREQIESSAGILLKVGREIVGVMFVNYRSPHKFNEDDRKIILNYASYIAIAIQNVRHFREKESLTALDSVQKLAAAIAHKMKNDIGAIRLNTSRLLKRTEPSRPEHEILTHSDAVLNKITADIDALLRASRLQEPKIRYEDLLKLIKEWEADILPELRKKNIEYKKSVEGVFPELKLDPLQIKMVFTNLLHNSINAMPQGGEVSLSVAREPRNVIICWQDTGTGVPVENASTIFEPYWTTKGKGSGFGVGLFLSKRVIEEHGGSIYLDLMYTKGARFIIILPVKEPIRDQRRSAKNDSN